MTTTHKPFPEGTRIRVTGRPETWNEDFIAPGTPGHEYTVEGFYDGSEEPEMTTESHYILDDEHTMGGSHWALPEHVELVRTVDEQSRMDSLPDPADIARLIQDGLMSGHYFDELGELEITETSLYTDAPTEDWPEGQHGFKFGVEFYGRRRGGAHFAGTVRLTSYYPADA